MNVSSTLSMAAVVTVATLCGACSSDGGNTGPDPENPMASSTWSVTSSELAGDSILDFRIAFDPNRIVTRVEYVFHGGFRAYPGLQAAGHATVAGTSADIASDWGYNPNASDGYDSDFAFEGTLNSTGTSVQGNIVYRIVEGQRLESGSGSATLTWVEPGTEIRPFHIFITPHVDSTRLNWQTDLYECWFRLTAEATWGQPGEYGTWLPSEVDTDEMNAQEIASFWGSDRIVTGETQTARRTEESTQPFIIVYAMRWRDPAGRINMQADTVDCR